MLRIAHSLIFEICPLAFHILHLAHRNPKSPTGVLTELTPSTLCFQKYGEQYALVGIDKEAKVATLASGLKIRYKALVSSMPLDLTLQRLGRAD